MVGFGEGRQPFSRTNLSYEKRASKNGFFIRPAQLNFKLIEFAKRKKPLQFPEAAHT